MNRRGCAQLLAGIIVGGVICGMAIAGTAPISPRLAAVLEKLVADSTAVRSEFLQLEDREIRALCEMIKKPGSGADAQARWALHGLMLAAGDSGESEVRARILRTVSDVLRGTPSSSDDAFLLRQLRLIADPRSTDTQGAALLDEDTCTEAAMGLLTLPRETATPVLTAALPEAVGRCRVAIIDALGLFGVDEDEGLFNTLLAYATSEDRTLRLSALFALARTGDERAAAALVKAADADTWYEHSRVTDLLFVCIGRLAERGQRAEAAGFYRHLLASRIDPSDTHVRCAALYGLATKCDTSALEDVFGALDDENPQVRTAAFNALVAAPGKGFGEAAMWAFEITFSGVRRAAILTILERRGDREAGLKAAVLSIQDSDPQVRRAAISAAATLGGVEAIQHLVMVLAWDDETEVTAAKEALIRIPGDDATTRIATWIGMDESFVRDGSSALNVRLLEVLAARPPTGDVTPILDAASYEDVEIRVAALRALEALGDAQSLPVVLDLLRAAQSEEERSAAGTAGVAIALRAEDREETSRAITAVIEKTEEHARPEMYRILGHVGGATALSALRHGLTSSDEATREAAVRAFQDWPDASAAPVVLEFARQTEGVKLHVLALRAYLRMVGLKPLRPAEERLKMCAAALEAARRSDERRQVIARLGEIRHAASVELLESVAENAELRDEAADALLRIAEHYVERRQRAARPILKWVLAADVSAPVRDRGQALLDQYAEIESYITEWWVAGPYGQEGKSASQLMDIVFPPERARGEVIEWRRQPVNENAHDARRIDLLATMAGTHRAGYLLTRIHSPHEQRAQLAVGSDDGIRVWLNRQLVHTNNVARGWEADADRINITLAEGWNELLLKITDLGGGWAASARLYAPDGSPLRDIRCEAGARP